VGCNPRTVDQHTTSAVVIAKNESPSLVDDFGVSPGHIRVVDLKVIGSQATDAKDRAIDAHRALKPLAIKIAQRGINTGRSI
jgi:hypothetical protein